MRNSNQWLIALLVLATLYFWSCQEHSSEYHQEHPSEVEEIEGSEFKRIILTEKAIERIDLRTDEVVYLEAHMFTSPHKKNTKTVPITKKVVPYSALIYGPDGKTFVYISVEPRVFVRYPVDVAYIEGDKVFLNEGPPIGTIVATVGAMELYGTEFKVGN